MDAVDDVPRRRAAVVGKPVEHSLSPLLHGAAYRELGLQGWNYERVEISETELADWLGQLGPEWVGLSVTMPNKHAALACADVVTARAEAVGAANTLVRTAGGWRADCTDVDGVRGALLAAGWTRRLGSGVLLGAGGTAAAAAVALAELGLDSLRLVVREPARAQRTAASARAAGLDVEILRFSDVDFARLAAEASVLISAVPSEAVRPHAAELAQASCVLDVIYDPWPTPLAESVPVRGRLATGLDMLLHQAFGQVEQFTDLAAPREAMRSALAEVSTEITPLPLG